MIERRRVLAAGVALLMTLPRLGSLLAQHASVSGTWTMSIEGMTMSMVLAQKGTAITGTLESPHGLIHVKGDFDHERLTLSGSLEGGPHPLEVSAKGVLRPDGTLAGDMATSVGDMKWTAVRDEGK